MSQAPEFVHLHNHLEYSLLDGAGKAKEYVEMAAADNQPAIGISDHGTVSGVYEVIREARKAGLTPVPGCEFYVAPQNKLGAKVMEPVYYGKGGQKAEFDVSGNGAYTHQTIWAINNTGLLNLFKLSTLSYQLEHQYSKPRIDINMIAEHSEGLVVASGCPSSEISTRLLMGQDKEAHDYARRLKEIFEDRFYIEIMEHHMNSPIERLLLPKQLEMSRKLGVELLATNDVHYTHQHDHGHHEELLCAQSGARMSDPTWDQGGARFAFDGTEYYVKTAQAMAELFPPEDFPRALSNTLLVADMAKDISLDYDASLRPRPILPKGETEVSYFRKLINAGFKARYGKADREIQAEAKKRIEHEFEVIHSSNFIGYFLTVAEYLNWTRDQFSLRNDEGDILALSIGVGRGSVGGSILAYLLNISELDPIRHDLIFERFLSAGRGDTYEVVYDDGSREEIIVSSKKTLSSGEEKYIYELSVGDELLEEDITSAVEGESEEEITDSPAPSAEEVTPPKAEPRPRKEFVRTATVNVMGPVPEDELTDLSLIPF